jgi:hypothetical protein
MSNVIQIKILSLNTLVWLPWLQLRNTVREKSTIKCKENVSNYMSFSSEVDIFSHFSVHFVDTFARNRSHRIMVK